MKLLASVACVVVLCSGCAVGNKYNYDGIAGHLDQRGTGQVSVGTHDQRPYVRSGDKAASFVGLQRGGWGNPFDVNTATAKGLSDDMTASLVTTLATAGYTTTAVAVTPSDSEDEARHKLLIASSRRSVLLTLNEWKSDTMTNVALLYDIKLSVFDSTGKLLASKSAQGRDNLGGSFMNPPEHAKKAVPAAFKAKIESLLNASEIATALK